MKTGPVVFLLLAVAAAGAAPAAAQRSVAEELLINVHGAAVRVGGDRGDAAVAVGGALGYGVYREFVVFIGADQSSMHDGDNEYRMRHIDVGARVHLAAATSRTVPFVSGGLTWRAATYDSIMFLGERSNVKVSGTGPTVGAGILFYPAPHVALEGAALWTGGDMDQVTVRGLHFREADAAITGSAVRLRLGVSWFPFDARRGRSQE